MMGRQCYICFLVLFRMLEVLAQEVTIYERNLWKRVGNAEYAVINELMNWQSAYHFCELYNGRLVVLNDPEKIRNLQHLQTIYGRHEHLKNIYWIGGNNLEEFSKWKWIPINKPFLYTHWHVGEPRQVFNHRCVATSNKTLGFWINTPCADQHYFICERDTSYSESLVYNY